MDGMTRPGKEIRAPFNRTGRVAHVQVIVCPPAENMGGYRIISSDNLSAMTQYWQRGAPPSFYFDHMLKSVLSSLTVLWLVAQSSPKSEGPSIVRHTRTGQIRAGILSGCFLGLLHETLALVHSKNRVSQHARRLQRAHLISSYVHKAVKHSTDSHNAYKHFISHWPRKILSSLQKLIFHSSSRHDLLYARPVPPCMSRIHIPYFRIS